MPTKSLINLISKKLGLKRNLLKQIEKTTAKGVSFKESADNVIEEASPDELTEMIVELLSTGDFVLPAANINKTENPELDAEIARFRIKYGSRYVKF